MKIEIRNLSYQAGKKQILNHINAVFEGNQICGVIGPNGCGKTTMLRHLYRKLGTAGSVFLDGRDIHSLSGKEFARRIAVMMQHQNIVEQDLLVRDVVRMGRYPYKNLLTGYNRQDESILDEVIRQTGLQELQFRRLQTLSGGEMQRVMIAKCFAQQPEVILLDEPINHLDIRYKVDLMNMLREFPGLVIMTLHDLSLAAKYCRTLYLMKDGEILCSGSGQEVLQEELLKQTYDVDIRIVQTAEGIYTSVS